MIYTVARAPGSTDKYTINDFPALQDAYSDTTAISTALPLSLACTSVEVFHRDPVSDFHGINVHPPG
jgi:hypothetical protein